MHDPESRDGSLAEVTIPLLPSQIINTKAFIYVAEYVISKIPTKISFKFACSLSSFDTLLSKSGQSLEFIHQVLLHRPISFKILNQNLGRQLW